MQPEVSSRFTGVISSERGAGRSKANGFENLLDVPYWVE